MKETPQQYVQRILGYVEDKDAMAVQRSTAARLAHLLAGLNRRHLRRRPAPGKWSIGEIVAHLAETELVGGYRIRMILSKNGTPILAFDQNVWAKNSDYARQDPRKSLELFRVLREANLRLLESLPPRRLRLYGMHQERGRETIARIVRLFAGHDINHLLQIEKIRKQSKG